ncbi:MAG: family 43 glycosylhydrolase [Oscillospiraceae bacterium]|nr:family 43 glycosylhydrolase [Oscillospiraceae bacterium]
MNKDTNPGFKLKESAGNPIITTIFTADPSAHVWEDGRIYIYPSHDLEPARGCDYMDRYHVYSSEDMVHWRDEGEILSSQAYSNDVPWGRKDGGFMWAPDCAYKNGTYYYYFPHPSGDSWGTTWEIGVATSNHPAKDFKVGDPGFVTWEGVGIAGEFMIDPAVLVDDDGRAYMYFGGGSRDDRCKGGQLNDDMITMKEQPRIMRGLEDFHEATWVFKRNGLYYLVYSDNHHLPRKNGDGMENRNQMRYATSENPLGPWQYRGVIIEEVGCGTSHGSVVEYKGQWYLFYHNQDISDRGNLRSVCVDCLYFNDDGTIQIVKQTKEGVKPVGPPPARSADMKKYPAKDAVLGGGAVINGNVAEGLEKEGSFLRFDNVDGGKDGSRNTLRISFSSAERVGKLRLKVNDIDYSLINLMPAEVSEFSDDCFITVKMNPGTDNTVTLTGGVNDVKVEYITVTPL